jgi:sec-independent protein translocase protein TatB
MFDFNWSEIALIGVVALVLIGPKDMPIAIRAISNAIKKMRRMAGEFQHHVDDMLRDADLAEVKSSIDEIRGMNFKGTMRRALDPDGSLRNAFEDPFVKHPVAPVKTRADQASPAPVQTPPSFVPPTVVEPAAAAPAPAEMPRPAFIPPSVPSRAELDQA